MRCAVKIIPNNKSCSNSFQWLCHFFRMAHRDETTKCYLRQERAFTQYESYETSTILRTISLFKTKKLLVTQIDFKTARVSLLRLACSGLVPGAQNSEALSLEPQQRQCLSRRSREVTLHSHGYTMGMPWVYQVACKKRRNLMMLK